MLRLSDMLCACMWALQQGYYLTWCSYECHTLDGKILLCPLTALARMRGHHGWGKWAIDKMGLDKSMRSAFETDWDAFWALNDCQGNGLGTKVATLVAAVTESDWESRTIWLRTA